eukprot:gene38340-4643_t
MTAVCRELPLVEHCGGEEVDRTEGTADSADSVEVAKVDGARVGVTFGTVVSKAVGGDGANGNGGTGGAATGGIVEPHA